jgi:hypothetical protein
MAPGTQAPKWAEDLIGQWIIFNDHHHSVNDVKAFIWSADCLGDKVRIFADTYESALSCIKTGGTVIGMYCTFLPPREYRVIDIPVELIDWTAEQLSDMKSNDPI